MGDAAPTNELTMKPQEGPQMAFLSSRADIVVYGGAAGGGKSWAILYEALRHVRKNPGYGAVIFRRLSTQIKNQGGLWDEAAGMYPQTGAVAKSAEVTYQWPKGGKVSFRHLQYEADKYGQQGAQIPYLGFDELTHFTESQFFYMLSRNRSTCGVKPYCRATTNPDAGVWVKKFLGPWVDRKHELYPTASGTVLFMVRVKGAIRYYRTREECEAENPGAQPKTVTFISASIYDNKILLEKDPGYLANLEAQTDVERARLLLGDWDVVNDGLVYPEFGSCVVEDDEWPELHPDLPVIGGLDYGWTDPLSCLTAVVDAMGVLWVDWEHYESRKTLTAFSKELTAEKMRRGRKSPRIYADPSGATQTAELRLAGHDVVACVHLGSQPIKAGVAIVTERIRSGRLKVRGTLGSLIDEANKYRYPDPGKGKPEVPVDRDNHLMDALRYMIVGHDRGGVVDDEEPAETEDEAREREAREEAEQAELEAEYRDPSNDHWWDR